jgi:oligopeptide/dipeptide ABC transporter ATP-binding protein
MSALIQVRDLSVHFPSGRTSFFGSQQYVRAVEGVSFDIHEGEVLGLVGESGCGKTTLGRAILRLGDAAQATTAKSRVIYGGQNLVAAGQHELRPLRQDLQIIFQDPFASLDPRMIVYEIVAEPIRNNGERNEASIRRRVHELIEAVGLATEHANRYPHEFSGGQRQRIGIARALASKPKFIVCDEPISALDVSIQAQVLNLLKGLQRQLGLTLLFISHDLRAVYHLSTRIAVMYLGKVVEVGSADQIVHDPQHPYTKALLSAIPNEDPDAPRDRVILTGDLPSPRKPPPGCTFHTRCQSPLKNAACAEQVPQLRQIGGRKVACDRLTADPA